MIVRLEPGSESRTGGRYRSTLARKSRRSPPWCLALSDIPPETPRIARAYCPACEPDADALLEILEVQWCALHMPLREGVDDARVMSDAMLTGSAEAGGEGGARRAGRVGRDGARSRGGGGGRDPPLVRRDPRRLDAPRGPRLDQRPGVAEPALVPREGPGGDDPARAAGDGAA